MPAIRRMARSGALTLITLGVTATTLAVTPAQAADDETGSRSGAVALNSSQVEKFDKRQAVRRSAASEAADSRLDTAIGIAQAQLGDPYSYGSAGPDAFDCSGLIYYSYRRAGLDVPRTSGAQAAHTRRIARNDMRKGDLMFFHSSGAVYHAAIFLRFEGGHAVMLDAPGSGQSVQVAVPWTDSWFGGTLR